MRAAQRRARRSRDAPDAVSGGAAIWALGVANRRFWMGVAPIARAELARWREAATEIPDLQLREMAHAKLSDEAFNAEVAATLATIAPRPQRSAVVKAIVALEVLFDYLDGRTEALFAATPSSAEAAPSGARPGDAALEEGRRLSQTLRAVIDGQPLSVRGADGEYLNALSRFAHEHVSSLPGHNAILPAALAAASRCAEGQLRLHAAALLGDEELELWAQEACAGSGLGWQEYVGGSASSVLAMHALIATAARADTVETEARALDATYLAIGAVITTLDSLVDEPRDRRAGESGYIRLYTGRAEIETRLVALIGDALGRAGRLRDGAHHTMTLAGVAAYYTTHPGAADPENRGIRRAVRRELTPAIWPALGVLVTWRAAKRASRLLRAATHRRSPASRSAGGEQCTGGR